MVSDLMFKFLMYFQLILCKAVVQLPQHHLLKRLSFPHLIFLAPES